jgi:type VI secretion system secreted protein Hcp
MALTGYLKLVGETQGAIEGDCKQAGAKENKILVYAWEHEIEIPKDTHTGLPTGQRVHKPFVITKQMDSASPKIMQACTRGEQLKEWQLDLYRITDKGTEEHYYSIKLGGAIIVKSNLDTKETFLEENKPYHNMEKISFSYSKIVHIFEPQGIEAEDDWTADNT